MMRRLTSGLLAVSWLNYALGKYVFVFPCSYYQMELLFFFLWFEFLNPVCNFCLPQTGTVSE